MKEKLCLALALTQSSDALFPGRFRSRESGLVKHWRLNAPPKPPIFIPRNGVLDNRIELDVKTRGNYDSNGKSKLSFQEADYVIWNINPDEGLSTLTSGQTRVKRDRDYCVKLDLIPLSPDLSLTVNLHAMDGDTTVQPFNMTVKTTDICSNGSTCVLYQESPKKRRMRPHPAHNTIELPPYRAESQHLTLQLISNATIGVNVALTDCSSQARLRSLKTTTTTSTTTTTTTTTTNGSYETTASYLDLLEDFTAKKNDSQVTTQFPFDLELPTDWSVKDEIEFFTPPLPTIHSTKEKVINHQVEELVEEIINIEHYRTLKKRPKLKMANANSSSSMTFSLAFGLLIASLHI